ncbi:hypothetical protein IV203_027562 [Nitzschia inconspicua]|uniref:Uncharacterized protein n=1 Tax=Nitzschia inconspicua TaxID=303405 RepID=A0A9K3LZ38_9STRA|nr:hypothetical protein IV203_027562 [Nitzschia inconspicua]
MKFLLCLVCLVATVIGLADALAAPKAKQLSAKDLPKFNTKTQRWEKAPNAEQGYPLYETALRNGPVPFFTRLTQSDDYEQAVLKFQASEKCSINEAQGNMDAYFENPNDWAFQRLQEERGGYKRDYGAPLDPKQVALTLVWGGGITAYILYLVYSLGSGKWCGVHPEANFCKVFFS